MEKYEILGIIGNGAQGTAYLVQHKQQQRRFVMKKVIPSARAMIEQEVQLLIQLKHPNIITYHECFDYEMCLHIVTEYYPGGDLERLLSAIRKKGQVVSPEVAKQWIVQLNSALQYCHEKNIIHRDVKTANVFLSEDQRTVMLGDFGIARKLDGAAMANTLVGSPYNFSPELVAGKGYDMKSDMWAYGCVVYEILTLKRPFDVDNISQLVNLISVAKYGNIDSTVPPNLKQLIQQLLQKDPRNRPSAKEVTAMFTPSGRRRSQSTADSPLLPPVPFEEKAMAPLPPPPPPQANSAPTRRQVTPPTKSRFDEDVVDMTKWAAQRYAEIDAVLEYCRQNRAEDEILRDDARRKNRGLGDPRLDLKPERGKVPQVRGAKAAQMAAAEEKREKLQAEREMKAQKIRDDKAKLEDNRLRNAEERLRAAESRRAVISDPRAPSTPPDMSPLRGLLEREQGGPTHRRSQTAGPPQQPPPPPPQPDLMLDNSLKARQLLREQVAADRAKARGSPTKPFQFEVLCKEPSGGKAPRKSTTPPPEPSPAPEPLPAVRSSAQPQYIPPPPPFANINHNSNDNVVTPPPVPQAQQGGGADKRAGLQAMMAQQRKNRVEKGNDFNVEIVLPSNLKKLPQNQM